jgi:hypothetical protein
MMLIGGPHFLPHFPITNLTVSGFSHELVQVDEEAGMIASELAPDSYHIEYEVGYPEGTLPALHRELIIKTAMHYRNREDPELAEEIAALTLIARDRKAKLIQERRGYATL